MSKKEDEEGQLLEAEKRQQMTTWLYIHTTSWNLPFPRDFIQYHYDMTLPLALHRIKSAGISHARFYVAP